MGSIRALFSLLAVAIGLATASSASAHPPDTNIIGGSTAPAGAAPYAAFLQSMPGDGFIYSCTGSLVAPQYVLTAGHCAFDQADLPVAPSAFLVVVGLSDWSTVTATTVRHVTAVHVYPSFSPTTLRGDVALLTLDQPAAAGTASIPLATPAQASLYAAGQQATIMGWGQTSNDPGAGVTTLLQLGTVAVQSNVTCNAAGSPIPFSPSFEMCVAAPGFVPSACHGDSGGPLVASTPTGLVEIGVVSYGSSATCGVGPDFFTRASSIQSWVASVISNAPAPSPFTPPFVAPTATVALNADGIVATFAAAADPATLPTGFVANLLNAASAVVSTQNLPPTATSASFPNLQPGTYTVSVSATYSEGASTATGSAPVTLEPPRNTTKPTITGKSLVGSTLTCQTGTWVWPGPSALVRAWLRNGTPTGKATPTYRLSTADAGKDIACQVQLQASTGSTVTATSVGVLARARLVVKTAPHLTGIPAVGAGLVCRAGTWKHTGALKLKYRWLRDGKPLGGLARAARRTVLAADAHHRLSCRVTAVAIGQTASATTKSILVPS